MAFTVAAIVAVALTTGPWPPILLAAALLWPALQRIERAARPAELERWYDREMEGER